MNFSSDEVNLFVYRYLREKGFQNSASSFAKESNILRTNIDVSQVPHGALISIIQKGYKQAEVQIELDNKGSNVKDLTDKLTLIEAARPDMLEITRKKKENQKKKTMRVGNNNIGELSKLNYAIYDCNPINNLLASGSSDDPARICNIDNVPNTSKVIFNSPIQILDEEETNIKKITCLDWSFDGNYLATGNFDGNATVWTTSGALRCSFRQDSPIFSLKFNQRGNFILTGGADGTTKIWSSVASHHCFQKFNLHSASVLAVAWKTNTIFASCSTDRYIYVCELKKGIPLQMFQGHTGNVNNIEWDPQGELLASCSDDTTVKIWSMLKDTCVYNFQGHSKKVSAVKWSPTGLGSRNQNRNLILASSSLDATIRLWDVESSLCVLTLTQLREEIFAIDFRPDGKFLVSASCDSFIYIWSLERGELVRSLKGRGRIFDVAWNSTDDEIAISSYKGDYFILDVRKVKL